MSQFNLQSVQATVTRHQSALTRALVCGLLVFMAFFSLSISIQYSDTDLWFHLAGGRYLLETEQLFNPYVYSYLAPVQEMINYFWGFQLLSFGTWSLLGEYGLVALKSLLIVLTAWISIRILLRDRPFAEAGILHITVMVLVLSLLCFRDFTLRPHLISYLMIPLFIFILEKRRSLYPVLPALALLWANLHGIEWVVGALICGSYGLVHLLDWLPDREDREPLAAMAWIAACLPAMLLNPNGLYLLATPFAHNTDLGLFIGELGPLNLSPVIDLSTGLRLNSLVIGLLIFVGAAFVSLARQPRRYLAALLMAGGGLILLSMGKRFIWEWMLLSLPLLGAALSRWQQPRPNLVSVPLLALLLILVGVTFWPAIRSGWQNYPYDRHSLPYGTTRFIQELGISGRYAIEPSYAGYVEFHLSPAVSVHMDMEFPPFTNLDYHDIVSAMQSAGSLRRYVAQYQPDMLGVMKSNRAFPDAAAREMGYIPILFDRKVVLYLDSNRYPDVTRRYELKAVNPFMEDQIHPDNLDAAVSELEAILAQVEMPELRLTLTGMLIESRRLDMAEVFLAEMRVSHPNNPSVAYFNGRIAHLNEDCNEAVTWYERALGVDDSPSIHREAAECYFLIGDQVAAYGHFNHAINPYRDPSPDALTYFQFALSAIGAGYPADAVKLLTMIRHFAPDSELIDDVDELLVQLNAD